MAINDTKEAPVSGARSCVRLRIGAADERVGLLEAAVPVHPPASSVYGACAGVSNRGPRQAGRCGLGENRS